MVVLSPKVKAVYNQNVPHPKIGHKLKKIRLVRGLTQTEIANKAEIHPNYYARIERDEANPSLEVFKNILKALKVKSSEIIDF